MWADINFYSNLTFCLFHFLTTALLRKYLLSSSYTRCYLILNFAKIHTYSSFMYEYFIRVNAMVGRDPHKKALVPSKVSESNFYCDWNWYHYEMIIIKKILEYSLTLFLFLSLGCNFCLGISNLTFLWVLKNVDTFGIHA